MKKLFAVLLLSTLSTAASAQVKCVSILGDSYSTFKGINPDEQRPFYPNSRTEVTSANQTWWGLYINTMGYRLEKNDSWGATTICNTGYDQKDVTSSAFNARADRLGNPDIIFLFGGTNDSWADAPIGNYQYANWSDDDCKAFRPAMACLIHRLQSLYPKASIYAILNSDLKEEINESSRVICNYYHVPLIELSNIEKQNGHPTVKGMQAICDQLISTISKF